MGSVHLYHCRTSVNDQVLSYILQHVGYVDSQTTIILYPHLLYPSIPSEIHFRSLYSWSELQSVYPSSSSFNDNYQHLMTVLTWNIYVYQKSLSDSTPLPFVCSYRFPHNKKCSNILLKGDHGTGKTFTLFNVLEQLHLPCKGRVFIIIQVSSQKRTK